MPTTATRPVSLVDFALALVELGVVPELSSPQANYLEALDGIRPPLTGSALAATARAGGRRYLRDLVAAHRIATGETVALGVNAQRAAAAARDDILSLATAYLAADGHDIDADVLARRLRIHVSQETPT